MALSIETLAVAKKYTDDSIAGGGALKGKNCVITSIASITGGHRVTFQWTLDNGTVQTDTMDVMDGADGQDGEDGKGIQSVSVNENNHLIITYSDGTTTDAGQIEIHSAVDSVNGQTGAVTLDAEDVGALPDNTPIPSKTSDLTNDSGFITKAVNDLVNYYLKSDTYSKTEVDDIVTAIKNSRFEVVATLPTTNIKTNVIYLVPKSPSQTSNVKDEYINLDGTTAGWEKIGDTEIDLSDYVTTQALNTALAAYTTTADLTTLLAGKQDTLTFDNVPTENSNNPVKSGGVFTSEQDIFEVMGQNGAKNLIPYPYAETTKTQNGVTFTDNGDGTITVNGTASANTLFTISTVLADVLLNDNTTEYILSGCEGGGGATYKLVVDDISDYSIICNQFDNEADFTIASSYHGIRASIVVYSGQVMSNVIFKPMVRLASDTDSTYQPYAKTNQQLTVETQALTNQTNDIVNVLGAKNLLPNKATTQTIGGVTYTINSDGTINMSGANTSGSWINLNICDSDTLKAILSKHKGQKMIFSMTQDYDYDTRNVCIHYNIGGTDTYIIPNPKEIEFTVPNNIDTATSITVPVGVSAGETANTTNLGLMLRLASDPDDTYEPYAMTNQQMTPYVQAISNPNLLDNPWFTVNQRGITNDWTTQFAYGVDRWRKQTSVNNTLQITDNGISATTSSVIGIYQVFKQADVKDLFGRILTFSIMYGDGTIESGSDLLPLDHYLPSSTKQKQFISNTTNCNYVQTESYSNGNLNIVVNTKAGTTIKAVKLEIGSVSTLAMDTAPNYATELAKCQRYYQRIWQKVTTDTLCIAVQRSNTLLRTVLPLTVPMRANPTVTVSGTVSDYTNSGLTMSKIGGVVENGGIIGLNFNIAKSGVTWSDGEVRLITPDANDFYIDLSADL